MRLTKLSSASIDVYGANHHRIKPADTRDPADDASYSVSVNRFWYLMATDLIKVSLVSSLYGKPRFLM